MKHDNTFCEFADIKVKQQDYMKKYYESIRLAQLLTKFVIQNISDIEKQELSSLIHKYGIDAGSMIRKAANQDLTPELKEADVEAGKRIWTAVLNDINHSKRRLAPTFLHYAAIAILIVGISGAIYLMRSENNPVPQEKVTLQESRIVLEDPTGGKQVLSDKINLQDILQQTADSKATNKDTLTPAVYKIIVSHGSTYSLTLEDSTKIFLFPGSELQFPAYFNTTIRSVQLYGEGYFEVKHDASRPFIVNAGVASIEVLGTSFNVRAYRDEKTIETVLVNGRVMMNRRELKPGQIGELDKQTQQVKIGHIDASIYSMRAQGMFVFDNKTLGEIMQEFSLWFDFKYEFEDTALQDKKFRLKMPRTDNFNKLMEMMEMTNEIKFSISGKNMIVIQNKTE